jgi:hypothetical protein
MKLKIEIAQWQTQHLPCPASTLAVARGRCDNTVADSPSDR